MTTSIERNVNCLVDLTALYDSRKRRKKLDYAKFTSFITMVSGVNDITDFQDFRGFTVFSPKNQEQKDFVSNLTNLGWEVETYSQYEIELLENLGMNPNDYRFNSMISFNIGSMVNDEVPSKIVLVSDSYDLYNIMQSAHKDDPMLEFLIIYFEDHMDVRWEKALAQSKDFIRFHDLNEIYRIPSATKSNSIAEIVAV